MWPWKQKPQQVHYDSRPAYVDDRYQRECPGPGWVREPHYNLFLETMGEYRWVYKGQ
jgi:hypothetical protein